MATPKKGGLGRGLDALFADVPVKEPLPATKSPSVENKKEDSDTVQYIKIHDIMPNVNQPRKTFKWETDSKGGNRYIFIYRERLWFKD